jgi:hypothetical protein
VETVVLTPVRGPVQRAVSQQVGEPVELHAGRLDLLLTGTRPLSQYLSLLR